MLEKPAFIQGLFAYPGSVFGSPVPHQPPASYSGATTPYFPVVAKGTTHVPLAVVEDLAPQRRIEVPVAAPPGLRSSALVDAGFMEVA